MTTLARRTLFWAPRALTIAFIAFLSLFALDVFGEGRTFWGTLLALGMHLVPSFVLLGMLILAWRWEWVGAAAYAAAGMLYVFWASSRPIPPHVKMIWVLTIAGPAFFIALLFAVNWWKRRELRARG